MKRIEREFCLTDGSVNCYGYRLLTEGMEIERFRPPIGFLMHDREKGVAVTWTDFRREGDAVYATPIVNDTLFPNLAQQIEEGFIAAASCGHIVALEVSEDDADKLPGQTGPTVVRWYPREVSLVDIPGNPNALARLYDEGDNVLHDLSAKIDNTNKKKDMDIKKLFPDLTVDAENEEEVKAWVEDLRDRARRCDAAEQRLGEIEAEMRSAEVERVLGMAQEEHRITAEVADCLRADYKGRPTELKNLVEKLPARKKVEAPMAKSGSDWKGLSWDELDRKGLLVKLKAENEELFKKKFQERFGGQSI